VFRFTFFDSANPYDEQISSPGFKIGGLVKASSTAVAQSSSKLTGYCVKGLILTIIKGASSETATSASFATTSSDSPSTQPSAPTSTQHEDSPSSPSENRTLIPVAVVGSVVGVGLIVGIIWYLRKRRSKRAEQEQLSTSQSGGNYYQSDSPGKDMKDGHTELATSDTPTWQQRNKSYAGQDIVEAPGYVTPKPPVELWEGNYRS
jgi:hypothetical protein